MEGYLYARQFHLYVAPYVYVLSIVLFTLLWYCFDLQGINMKQMNFVYYHFVSNSRIYTEFTEIVLPFPLRVI